MNRDKLEWDLSLCSGDTDTVVGKVTHCLVDFSAFVSSPVLLDDNGARSLSQELSPTGEVKNQSVSCGMNIYNISVPYLCLQPLMTLWIISAFSLSAFIRSISSMVSWKSWIEYNNLFP